MYVYANICMHVLGSNACMHARTIVYMYVCKYLCTYARIQVYMQVWMYIHSFAYTHICMYAWMQVHRPVYAFTVYTYIPRKLIDKYAFITHKHTYLHRVKVKLSLCLTNYAIHHQGLWGSGCIDPHFLDLSTSWR
jgi:hypothetical protein